jgi:hypothetical protein
MEDPLGSLRCSAQTAAPQVHRRSVEVGGWVGDASEPVPALQKLHEGVLGDLLSLMAVPGEQPECPEQLLAILAEEFFEGGLVDRIH